MTRLLLVDDHRMLREGLRRSLEDHGFDVVGRRPTARRPSAWLSS